MMLHAVIIVLNEFV